jgi:hypothetical protein
MRKYTWKQDTGFRMQDTDPSSILDPESGILYPESGILYPGSFFLHPDQRQPFFPDHLVELNQVFFHDLFQIVQLYIGLAR